MMKAIVLAALTAAGALLGATTGYAATPQEMIREKLQAAGRNIPIAAIRPSVVDNLYEVELATGERFYATADGGHFLVGDLYEVSTAGFRNLTEEARNQHRADAIAALDESEMLIFSPQTQPAKATVTVFTDVDCVYCRKLHREVPRLNELGIEVRYLAFPRAGVGSAAYDKMVSAWCADNPQQALTQAKQGKAIAAKTCSNPVSRQYQLGKQLGVSGTPALVLEDGRLVPGYMPAERLATALGVKL